MIKLSKDFQSRLINGTLKFLEWAIGIVPRWLVDLFIECLFPIVFLAVRDVKQICKRNFQLVYGESKDRKKYEVMTREYIKSIGHAMMDLLYYVDRGDALSKITTIENENNLKEALKLGRGVIAVSAHFGNFPLMFVSLVQKGYKVNVIIRGMRDENFGKFMYQQCDKWGIKMIQTSPGKQFLRESLGALKRNEILFFLHDEVVSQEKGVKVKFFNHEVTRAIGPVLFSERTSSPIVPIFMVQDENKHFKIFIGQTLAIDKQRSPQENIEKDIIDLNSVLEHFVSRYPFQWGGWFNKKGFRR